MRFLTAAVLVLSICLRSIAAEPRVMIVSIDGLRPDCLLLADAPNLHALVKTGSFSFWATTTTVAVTLPSHTSMLTGVVVERHGIVGNDDKAAAEEVVLVPSIFDLAKKAGISTGMAAGKSKFSIFKAGIDHYWVSEKSKTTDDDVAEHAVQLINENKPQLFFVHFPDTDGAGHSHGWGSPEQMTSIANTDKQLGKVLAALTEAGVRDDTTIIISADHGGEGKKHGSANAAKTTNQSIPWILNGPGVRKGLDLTLTSTPDIRTYDTFATACKVLGIKTPEGIDGKAITAAFNDENLMQPATQNADAGKP